MGAALTQYDKDLGTEDKAGTDTRPACYEKYIVMLYATHEKRNESLAEYYYRMNKHLLGTTKVASIIQTRTRLK